MIKRVYSGAPWEKKTAYCRALKKGNFIFVAGTTAVEENGGVMGIGDMLVQARAIFAKIRKALNELGADFRDVVRTRMYITDMNQLESVIKAHFECFQHIDPVATCVAVSALAHPDLLIEIEVDAMVDLKT